MSTEDEPRGGDVLLYGCADFSDARAYVEALLSKLKEKEKEKQPGLDQLWKGGVRVVATEIRTKTCLGEAYGIGVVNENLTALERMGAIVEFGIDATNHQYLGSFDEIVFRNPHTGDYSDASDHTFLKASKSIGENNKLFENLLEHAKNCVAPAGRLLVTVSGWPFIGGQGKTALDLKGLQLEKKDIAKEYARRHGWLFCGYIKYGMTTKRRNTGGRFQSEEIGLLFRENVKRWDPQECEHQIRAYLGQEYHSHDLALLPKWVQEHPSYSTLLRQIRNEMQM